MKIKKSVLKRIIQEEFKKTTLREEGQAYLSNPLDQLKGWLDGLLDGSVNPADIKNELWKIHRVLSAVKDAKVEKIDDQWTRLILDANLINALKASYHENQEI